ncbi:MAG: DUF5011 domain-containing protein, partial [Bacteroidota bacterium]|nr:DUF5011 domain-containing protein [Bacteroidota bacterium]
KDAKQGYWWYHNGVFKTNDLHYTTTFGAGTYSDTISLTVENCGGTDTYTKIIVIDTPSAAPNASFIADLNLVQTYYPVQFTDISTNCPSSWSWTVSPDSVYDGGLGVWMSTITYIPPTFPTSQNPLISFDYPGQYKICLTASNIKGASSTCKEEYIIVKPSQWMCMYVMPSVSNSIFGYLYDDGGPQSNYIDNQNCEIALTPCAEELTFSFSEFKVSSGDYFRIYEGKDNTGTPLWNQSIFGTNGITGNLGSNNMDTSYTSNTGYIFIEWESNASGTNTGFEGEWFGVEGNYPKPNAYFEGPDTVCLGAPVFFENLTKNDNYSYSWDFDNDGFVDSYGEDGEFSYMFLPWNNPVKCKLTVTSCGGDSTFTKFVYVKQPNTAPIPNFTADVTRPVVSKDVVTFTDLSEGCINTWEWSISPTSFTAVNGFPNSRNPQVTFNDTGYYHVTLKGGYFGKDSTITKDSFIYVINYCYPNVKNLNPDIGISRVVIADINNSSQIGSQGYTDYSGSSATALDLQGKYLITLERNTTYNAMNRKVWIDFDIDGEFDASEIVAQEGSAQTISWSDSIAIPANATEGATRMRVATSLGSMSNDPCGERLFGEIEDYRIFIRPDATPPIITLIGQDTVTLDQCTCPYNEAGASALDNIDGIVTASLVSNNVDCSEEGIYYVTYEAKDSRDNLATKTRVVIVEADNINPTVSLVGNAVYYNEVHNAYVEPGYTADDTCSGLDTVLILGTVNFHELGEYILNYVAYDNKGNTDTVSRKIVVGDTTLPQVSLKGYSIVTIEVHNQFNDEWVDVSDNYCDSADIIVSVRGSVDTEKLGSYSLYYDVTDCNGNGVVTVSRTVNVVDTTAPVITYNYNDGDTITVEVFDRFELPNLQITDNYDEGLNALETGSFITTFPSREATTLGVYDAVYTVTDASFNTESITLYIKVVDTEKPIITLIGLSVENVCRYEEVLTDSVTVSDNYYSYTNTDVNRTGSYFTDYLINRREGFYAIRYNITDGSNNVADEVVRYIDVAYCAYKYDATEETGLSELISVYPNPTKGIFVLDIELPKAENINVQIVNTLGKTIKTIDLRNITKVNYEIDLGEFSNGLYFVRIQTDNDISVKRITLTK